MKECVTKAEVSDFKKKWCNENQIISGIILNGISDCFHEPILDVGSGLGDIVFNSLFSKRVICIDVNEVSDEDYPVSKNHERQQIDFFDYIPADKINTVFISHTLQFLDENIDLLQKKIDSIDPESIILILNKNDDILGDLIDWSQQNFSNPNPEVSIPNFPEGYELQKLIEFQATLMCKSFKELATQISYLMLIDLDESLMTNLIEYLVSKLDTPGFNFNQQIKIYSKHGKQ